MKFKKFANAMEMYHYICSGNDLYSKSLNIYIFVYNDANALCSYRLTPNDVANVMKESNHSGECWGAHLDWRKSEILDACQYDDDKHRYSKNWELNKLYLKPSLDFCEQTYMTNDWLDTKDVTATYVLKDTNVTNVKTERITVYKDTINHQYNGDNNLSNIKVKRELGLCRKDTYRVRKRDFGNCRKS